MQRGTFAAGRFSQLAGVNQGVFLALCGGSDLRGMIAFFFCFHHRKISALAAGHKTFGDALQFLPALPNGGCFLARDMVVRRRRGDDRQ